MNEKNLHDYQLAAINHIICNHFAGVFLDMGLGKTVSTLTALNRLKFDELAINRVLIVAPKRVAEKVWSDEVKKWDHLRHLRISKIIGTPAQRVAALKGKADIYLISRDNIAWLCGQFGGSMLPFDTLVIDESSSFKNHQSQRFKALKRVQPSFDRVVILTGTPTPNSLIELWPQMYLLDRGERLGKTIGAYRERYFTPGQRNGHIVYKYNLRKDSEGAIYKAIGDICISMKAEDYLDMPDRVDNVVSLSFSDKLQRQYEEFQREQVLELMEGGEITAINAAALSNKLLQFANGAVYDENKKVHEIHSLKLEAVEEIIENANGRPVLIAYTYQHDRDRLLHHLRKYKPVVMKTEQHQDDWNAGRIPVMLLHPASGGHGLNLQDGGNVIAWFGQTWSLELYQQFCARIYRQGQKAKNVFIHNLAVENTLDMKVIASRERKDKGQEGLLKAIKALVRRYANN
jgi:SNF2 family DNA or RNA helicase